MLGLRAIGELALSELPPDLVTITESVTERYASHSFVTRDTDTPAHAFIGGRISRGIVLKRELSLVEAGQIGALIRTEQSEIELSNVDGALDTLIDDFFVDGRALRLRIGATEIDSHGRERVQPYGDFELVYTAVAGVWTGEHDVLRLRIQDRSLVLQDRLQTSTYGGGGGESGTDALIGRSLPVALGRCLNVTAQLVDPILLTYQAHDGSMDSITAVYDAGVEVPGDGSPTEDYADYDALATATVPAGTFATSLADGFFRLGTTPTGTITADVRGDNNLDGYTDEHGGVLKRILMRYSSLVADDLDADSFDALTTAQPASMGIFFPAGDQSTIEQAVATVAFSCGAFAGQDRSGLYRVQRLETPPMTPDWSFDETTIISIEREPLPFGVPWRGWGVGFQVNWTVQLGSDLATGVTPARRQFLEAQSRFAFAQNADIAIAHATSTAAPLRPSLFLAHSAAAAEASRLFGLYALGRGMYRLTVKTALFSVEIGHTVEIQYPRWNLHEAKNFVVISIDDDGDAVTTDLLVFG